MAANFDSIDLNSDVISVDRGKEACEPDVIDNALRVGESGVESVVMNQVQGFLGDEKMRPEAVGDGLSNMDVRRELEPVDRMSDVQAEMGYNDSEEFRREDVIENAGGLEEGQGVMLDDKNQGVEDIREDMECEGDVEDKDPLGIVAELLTHRSGESEGDRNTKIMSVCVPDEHQNESNEFSLVVDLNPEVADYGNLKPGSNFLNQGIEAENMLRHMELPGPWGEADCYANEVGSSGNCDRASQEPTKDNGNSIVKLAAIEQEFCVNDLVWGKVKSHPWWPGQIFDPSASSEKAKKYQKKDSFLIAYFGDQTFAWNEASRIKPFQAHFSQMEKQSNMEDFHYAVDCALDEVARRVEYGLACSCLSEEVHSIIKTQIIVNAGIREESSRRDGGDRFLNAISFDPTKLVEYIKTLGRLPYGRVDRLEQVIAQAQLLALYRWKGYSQLPEFNMLGDLLENDADIVLSIDVNDADEALKAVSDYKDINQVPSDKGKLKIQDRSNCKRKQSTSNTKYPSKKEKSLSDLMAEKSLYVLNGETGSERKAAIELRCSSISGKKRKAVNSMSDDLKMIQRKRRMSTGTDRIQVVARQLNGSEAALASPYSSRKSKKSIFRKVEIECSSPDELLSQLFLSAKDPMKGYSFLISVIGFFSEYRNSVTLSCASSWKQDRSLEQVFGFETKSEIAETPDLEYMKDSYWTDMLIQSNTEVPLENWNKLGDPETLNQKGLCTFGPEGVLELSTNFDSELQTAGGNLDTFESKAVLESITNLDSEQQMAGEDLDTSEPEAVLESTTNLESGQQSAGENLETFEPEAVLESGAYFDSEQQTAGGNFVLETMKPESNLEDCRAEEISPTALILNFSYFDSVPSVTNLNMIFSRFGPLDESGTEVIQKNSRAKVIFKRRSDAETAFSSAGKYSIFGPSLVSYRLKYLPFTPIKASLQGKK